MSTLNLTINQAAEKLGVSTRTIRRYIKSGKIQAELINGPFGEEYRIYDLPAGLSREDAAEDSPLPAALESIARQAKPDDFLSVFRELQEKNLALAAQLGAASERIRTLEGQLKLLGDGKGAPAPWWKRVYASLKTTFSMKPLPMETIDNRKEPLN
jgi:MerR family transcriptional regulator, copper efflux regulator